MKFPTHSRPIDSLVVFAVLANVILAFGLVYHLEPLNGPAYWFLPWRDTPVSDLTPALIATLLFLSIVPIAKNGSIRIGTFALGLWLFLAPLCFAVSDSGGIGTLSDLVRSFRVTGYFNYAQSIEDPLQWIRSYHTLPRAGHPSTHPPGWILFYWGMIQIGGEFFAPYLASLVLSVILAFSLLLFRLLLAEWNYSEAEQKIGMMLYATTPGLLLWLPGIDLALVTLTISIVYCWERALKGSSLHAMFCGALLWLGTFVAYNILVLGLFLAGRSFQSLRSRGMLPLFRQALVALVTLFSCGVLFEVTTGFHTLDTFRAALHAQDKHVAKVPRPYWECVLIDPFFFLYSAGLAPAVLLLRKLPRLVAHWTEFFPEKLYSISLLVIVQFLAVNFSGLLPAETNRLWLFLIPLWWLLFRSVLKNVAPLYVYAILASQLFLAISIKANFWLMKP